MSKASQRDRDIKTFRRGVSGDTTQKKRFHPPPKKTMLQTMMMEIQDELTPVKMREKIPVGSMPMRGQMAPTHPGQERTRTQLQPDEEQIFQQWYAQIANKTGINRDPDDFRHKYDYRGAFKGGHQPDVEGHWPSEFKDWDHPNRFIAQEGGGRYLDTKTGEEVTSLPEEPLLTPPKKPAKKARKK